MRISNNMIFNQSIVNLNNRVEQFFKHNEVVSTGKRVNRPSDDPIDSGKILGYRSLLSSIEQYKRNVNTGETWLNYTESALGSAEEIFIEAKVLAEQMANGTYNEDQREMMVGQAEAFFDQLMQVGNTKVVDRYIFSGFKTDTKTFTRDNNFNVQYHGDNSDIKITIQQDIRVKINTTGQNAFIDDTNVFNILRDLRNALENNDEEGVAQVLPRIDEAINKIVSERAYAGTNLHEMQTTKMLLQDFEFDTEELLSLTEDADMIEAVTMLQTHETAYEAALQATSMITSLSLVNFV